MVMYALTRLIDHFDQATALSPHLIEWGSPVPYFGNLPQAKIATVGLNPSNREFVDTNGSELTGPERRFHTLGSLGIDTWEDVHEEHLRLMANSFNHYFSGNPYNAWFRVIDRILADTGLSYYGVFGGACHIDLIPYATSVKWSDLSQPERRSLSSLCREALLSLLRESTIECLVLNGRSVVESFQLLAGVDLGEFPMANWTLLRGSRRSVRGVAYVGQVNELLNTPLDRTILILGYNHNLQSSFGVTREVIGEIRSWVGSRVGELLDATE